MSSTPDTRTARQARKAAAIYNLLVRATDVETADLEHLSDEGWRAAARLAWECQPADDRPAEAWTDASDVTRRMVALLFEGADIAGDGRPQLRVVHPAPEPAAVAGEWTPQVGDKVTPAEGRAAGVLVGTVLMAAAATHPGQPAEVSVAWPTGLPGKDATVQRWELAADLKPALS